MTNDDISLQMQSRQGTGMTTQRPSLTANQELDEMKKMIGLDTDRELASFLETSSSNIAAIRRRNSLPDKYRLRFLHKASNDIDNEIDAALQIAGRSNGYGPKQIYHYTIISIASSILWKSTKLDYDDEIAYSLVGSRLVRLGLFVYKRLSSIDDDDLPALKKEFENLRSEVLSQDLPMWLELLPSSAFPNRR